MHPPTPSVRPTLSTANSLRSVTADYLFAMITIMNMPTLQQLAHALRQAWSAETGYAGEGVWTKENPARGQCVTSSLVVQDYFGGDIVRYQVSGEDIDETHYFNILHDGTIVDTTKSQYSQQANMIEKPIDLKKNNFHTVRERCLADEETKCLYETLKTRVEDVLRGSHIDT